MAGFSGIVTVTISIIMAIVTILILAELAPVFFPAANNLTNEFENAQWDNSVLSGITAPMAIMVGVVLFFALLAVVLRVVDFGE